MIYLDNAATSQFKEKDEMIVNTISNAMRMYWQNPSSLYAQTVRDKIEECRQNVASFIGAESDEIYFTSGASESNNWAIRGWFDKNYIPYRKKPCVIISEAEHKSTMSIWENQLMKQCMSRCSVDKYGLVDLDYLKTLLSILTKGKKQPILMSVIYANNEVGSINNIKAISELVHKYGGVLHVDATQVFGHMPIDVEELGADMLSASGHKISPVLKGIGFLYKRNGVEINPLIYGTQESELRGGTENAFGIIGLSKAIDYCDVSNSKIEEVVDKRDYLIDLLQSEFGCKLNGHPTDRLPNNISVMLPDGVSAESVLHMLSTSNIFISTSSACNSQSIEKSYVLKAMGLDDEEIMRTIRVTISDETTYSDINDFVCELRKTIKVIGIDWSDSVV